MSKVKPQKKIQSGQKETAKMTSSIPKSSRQEKRAPALIQDPQGGYQMERLGVITMALFIIALAFVSLAR
ncbi:MAG: hypothetical protein JNN26_25655 [Candidatus Obscuribacter sp.]|nr:hypothetical protein [Candidatus Obscuribacter sp.]